MSRKKLLRSKGVRTFLTWLLAKYMGFVYRTTRWEWVGKEHILPYWKGKPMIGAFWHNRIFMISFVWHGPPDTAYMLISGHQDGQLISETVHYLGIKTIVGSSSQGGAQAARHMVALAQQNKSFAVTPDGPRGPRYKARPGVITLARLTELDIVPLAYSVTRRWVLGSWDRFLIALPFGQGVFVVGEPLQAPSPKDKDGEALEKHRQRLENALMQITNQADTLCGHPPEFPPS